MILSFRRAINLHLKNIEKKLILSAPLRLETARDYYASCLNRPGIPTKFISELMVHSSVVVTENYLSAMNNKELFDANSYLFKDGARFCARIMVKRRIT